MSELWTAALTILGGILVYVTGQIIAKSLIEPVQELKKVIGEVRFTLAFHARVIHTPIARQPEPSSKAYEAILRNSCDLLAKLNAIPFYDLISCVSFGFLPSKSSIVEAAKLLRGLSTYVHDTGGQAQSDVATIASRVERIEECLNLVSLE